jgi:hypothetical protein
MRTLPLLLLAASAVFGGAACSLEHSLNPVSPTANQASAPATNAAVPSFLGSWASSSAPASTSAGSGIDTSSCTGLKFVVSAQTAVDITGQLSATCMGNMVISAIATGALTSPTTVSITVNGTGSVPAASPCSISITATGTLVDNALHIAYTGASCLGPFSGNEVLRKSDVVKDPTPAPAPDPAPAPAPDPQPQPQPQQQPWEACGSLVNDKLALVQCVHDIINPGSSGAAAFEVTKRVAWLLRGEGGGLLIKNGGENIISWQGYSFSISRMCFPDGHIFKVITDAGDGGSNGAGWADNDFVDPSLYVPAIDPR